MRLHDTWTASPACNPNVRTAAPRDGRRHGAGRGDIGCGQPQVVGDQDRPGPDRGPRRRTDEVVEVQCQVRARARPADARLVAIAPGRKETGQIQRPAGPVGERVAGFDGRLDGSVGDRPAFEADPRDHVERPDCVGGRLGARAGPRPKRSPGPPPGLRLRRRREDPPASAPTGDGWRRCERRGDTARRPRPRRRRLVGSRPSLTLTTHSTSGTVVDVIRRSRRIRNTRRARLVRPHGRWSAETRSKLAT